MLISEELVRHVMLEGKSVRRISVHTAMWLISAMRLSGNVLTY
jgi:hypothetical protein